MKKKPKPRPLTKRPIEPPKAKREISSYQRELARAIASYLFTNGVGERADRLVMVNDRGHDLGGWVDWAAENRIAELLADHQAARGGGW